MALEKILDFLGLFEVLHKTMAEETERNSGGGMTDLPIGFLSVRNVWAVETDGSKWP